MANKKPTVTVTSHKNGSKVSGTVTVSGTASDPDGTVVRVELALDVQAEWEVATGTESWSHTRDTEQYGVGKHTLYVRAYDGEDYSDVVSYDFTVVEEGDDDGGFLPGFGVGAFACALMIILAFIGLKRKEAKFMKKKLLLKSVFLVILTVALLMVLASGSGGAEGEETGYEIDCRYVGGLSGGYRGVAHEGEYLYVAHGSGVSIFNVSTPSQPEKVGFIYTPSVATAVAAMEEYAYVADGDGGLLIVDVSDKTNPEVVGHCDTEGDANGIFVENNYAYIADGANGLVIIDVTSPTEPGKVGQYDMAQLAEDVCVAGDYVYIADKYRGLVIVDATDKLSPQRIGYYDTKGYAFEITVAGDNAYVADYDNGLVIVDISDKENPQEVGHYDTTGSAYGVTVSGDYAYVADSGNGLVIVDITDRTDPKEAGHYDTADYARGVVVSGDYAYVADSGNGLVVVDVTDGNTPQEVGHYDTFGYAIGVDAVDDHAYVANYRNGLMIIDVSEPGEPQEKGHCETADYAYNVAVAGDYAYVADRSSGLVIVDITDKSNPQDVGHYDTSGLASGVAVSGSYVYVADYTNGLVIIDISNKGQPQEVGHYDTAGQAYGVTVSGMYAYVADAGNGLVIIDIGDHEHPSERGSLDTNGSAYGVSVVGDHCYVADGGNGLVIVDVSDKSNPQEIGHHETTSYARAVAVSGDHAYVADNINGLVVVDVSNKSDPRDVGHLDSSSANGVAVDGDYAYVADYYNGLVIVELAPIAWLDDISPNPAFDNEAITFKGYGTDEGSIRRYAWRSSIDGELYNGSGSSFETDELSIGEHTIYFRVRDNHGVWSDEVSTPVIVTDRPIASIDSISPAPALDTDTVLFRGHGRGKDGRSIVRYVWRSSMDGELHNSTGSADFSTDGLSLGEHTISFRVVDDQGDWGDEYSQALIVTEKPVAHIDSISPTPALDVESVSFEGHGTDDGTIERYIWTSSIDGEIHNDTRTADFSTGSLSNGTHTISFRVQDNVGFWSGEVATDLHINGRPWARIASVSPDPAPDNAVVSLVGNTTDDGVVRRYVWTSSLDGEIYNGTGSANFSSDTLSVGRHSISFQVEDDEGIWSPVAWSSIHIVPAPTATIESISPPAPIGGEYSPVPVDESTVLYLPFNNGTGGQVYDGSGMGNHGTIDGARWTGGRFGSALSFFTYKDNTDTVSIPSSESLNFTGPFSIEAWIKLSGGEGYPTIIEKTSSTDGFELELEDDGTLKFWVEWAKAFSTVSVTDGKWHHVVAIYVPYTRMDIYLDGEMVTDEDRREVSTTIDVNAGPVVIGSDLKGTIDEIAIHTRVLTDGEIMTRALASHSTTATFSGNGTSNGTVERYVWHSSIDGEIYNGSEKEFSLGDMSLGEHTISLRAMDSYGFWSEEADVSITVHQQPVAAIESVSPGMLRYGDTVTLQGSGTDDGSIQNYAWRSSIDGELYEGPGTSIELSNLSKGKHMLFLKVLDNNGAWSSEVCVPVTVGDVVYRPDWELGDQWRWRMSAWEIGKDTQTMIITERITDMNAIYEKEGEEIPCYEMFATLEMASEKQEGRVWLSKDDYSMVGHDFTGLDEPAGAWTYLPLLTLPIDIAEGNAYFTVGQAEEVPVGTRNYTSYKFTARNGNGDVTYSPEAKHIVGLDITTGTGFSGVRFTMLNALFTETDGDGIPDEDDAFPTDPAASKDTDGDGYPDEWNTGMTEEDSTTGLKLDEFPDDPKKWEKEDEDDGPGFELAFLVMAVVATLLLMGSRRRRR